MATAKIGGVDLSAATAANVLQAGTSGGTYSCRIFNRGTVDATVRLGKSDTSATFSNATLLVYDIVIPAKGWHDESGIVLDASDYLVAESDVTSVNAFAFGWDA